MIYEKYKKLVALSLISHCVVSQLETLSPRACLNQDVKLVFIIILIKVKESSMGLWKEIDYVKLANYL